MEIRYKSSKEGVENNYLLKCEESYIGKPISSIKAYFCKVGKISKNYVLLNLKKCGSWSSYYYFSFLKLRQYLNTSIIKLICNRKLTDLCL